MHSDHRNAIFAATPAVGAAILTVGAKSNSDHRNSYFAAMLAAGAAGATKGSAFGIRMPSRRLDPSFVSWCASKSYANITRVGQIITYITKVGRSCIPTIGMQSSRQYPPLGAAMLAAGAATPTVGVNMFPLSGCRKDKYKCLKTKTKTFCRRTAK